jgi:hypothetical protein
MPCYIYLSLFKQLQLLLYAVFVRVNTVYKINQVNNYRGM